MVDLTSSYLGLTLSGPVIASAGPTTGRVEGLLELEAAGAAAVVLPSVFEEEVADGGHDVRSLIETGGEFYPEFRTFFPYTDFYHFGPQRHVRLVEEAKQRLSIPVIASVNAIHPGPWQRYAVAMADAGADAIELNLYSLVTDPDQTAAQVEADHLRLVQEVRAAIDVPLAVKLSPFFSALPHFAAQVVAAGADGLVLFNRFLQPDLSLRTFRVQATVPLSAPDELRLPLRWLAILRPQLPQVSLAANSGVHSARDVVKALLVGADVVAMTSAVLQHGPDHVRTVLNDLEAWLQGNDYTSVAQLRAGVHRGEPAAPEGDERVAYLRVLSSWLSRPAL